MYFYKILADAIYVNKNRSVVLRNTIQFFVFLWTSRVSVKILNHF